MRACIKAASPSFPAHGGSSAKQKRGINVEILFFGDVGGKRGRVGELFIYLHSGFFPIARKGGVGVGIG